MLGILRALIITLSTKPSVVFCPGGTRRIAEIVSAGSSEGITSRISQEDGYWKVTPVGGSVYDDRLLVLLLLLSSV
jgi:hypothetical protein